MRIREQILQNVHAFLEASGMSQRQFGVEAVGDNKFVARLESGAGITLTTIEKVESYIEKHQRRFDVPSNDRCNILPPRAA